MEQNPLQEYCPHCGSSNVYLVERWMLLWEVLAMIPLSFGLLSPVFLPHVVSGKEKQRKQDKKYTCSRCNETRGTR
jgi:predicted RNA-binding Zn-ribbon protein involved in translation (DUF1610 family)